MEKSYQFPSSRDFLAVMGIASVFSARHFFRARQLWPFRISVITAWPSIGVAVMETVIMNSTPANIKRQEGRFSANVEEAERIKANNSAFVERMKANVARSTDSL